MSVVSNGHLWIYTFVLLIFWIIVLTTAFNHESNIKNKIPSYPNSADSELKNIGNCKNICKQCGCLGFYCGEECICECNNDHSDTECIRKIQITAQNLNIPFEILIQGPTANKFVRNALLFEQNRERNLYAHRNKRSTVTVYKPNKGIQNKQQKSRSEKKTIIRVKNRSKRSSNNFDWFSDLRNNLLRPAPLGAYKRQPEESITQPAMPPSTTVSSVFDNSWIFDNTHNILTPRPLNRLRSSKVPSDSNNENYLDSSIETTHTQTYHSLGNKLNNDYAYNPKENINYSEINDKNYFLPEQNDQLGYTDYHAGDPYAQSFKHDLSDIENDKYLFSEDNEEKKPKKLDENKNDGLTSGLFKTALTASQVASKTNNEEGLPQFRNPWLKAAKFLEKLRKVIDQ